MPTPREQPKLPQRVRRRKEPMPGSWPWLLLLILFGLFMIWALELGKPGPIEYSKFMDLAKDKKFSKVVLRGGNRLVGKLTDNAAENLPEDAQEVQKQR